MQKQVMPQEIEVWYLIPALRKELAKIFMKEYSLSQKKCAEILGITESAISQYIGGKRGEEISFSNEEKKEIKRTAEKMIKDKKKNSSMKHIYDLCVKFRDSRIICDLHKKYDKNISKECEVCFDD